jgi:hypothetical protein
VIRRLRLVLPPAEAIVAFTFAYVVLALVAAFRAWNGTDPRVVVNFRIMLHVAALGAYGVFRVVAFHPFYRPGYRQWLESTPWTAGKPLPNGPIHFVWVDAVLFVVGSAPAWWEGDMAPVVSLSVVLAFYLLALGTSLWGTGEWAPGVLVLFGIGLSVRLSYGPRGTALVILAATWLVAMAGLARALRRWPWGLEWQASMDRTRRMQSLEVGQTARRMGWPFDRLGPGFPAADFSYRARDLVLGALLGGWWFHVGLAVLPAALAIGVPQQAALIRMTLGSFILSHALPLSIAGRLVIYLRGYAPPINLWGRILTFRWIIPSYDQVFATPFAAAIIGGALPFWLAGQGIPMEIAAPIDFTVVLCIIFLGGPSRASWWLTARHRIVPAAYGSEGFIRVG